MGLSGRSTGELDASRRPRHESPWAVAFLGGVPACLVAIVVWADLTWRGTLGDFRIFREAGSAVLAGTTPYVAADPALLAAHDRFVYPAPIGFLFSPFSLLPLGVARIVFLLVGIGAVLAALRLLGVRDWRCYGAAFLLAPTLDDLVLGSMSVLLLLGVAAAWRLRDRPAPVSAVVALVVLAKLALWPLVLWLVVTRRYRAAVGSVAVAAALAAAGWAAIGFAGLRDYPRLLRVLARVESRDAYSVSGVLSAHGVGTLAVPVLLAVAGAAVVAAVGRRASAGDSRVLAVAVAVALFSSPIVWLHYFVLLLVPIALARPLFSPLWLAPLAFWLSPWPHADGSAWRVAAVLGIAGGIVVVATKLRRGGPRGMRLRARPVPAANRLLESA